jgi:soluble lytic murein transglycosylase-like protein
MLIASLLSFFLIGTTTPKTIELPKLQLIQIAQASVNEPSKPMTNEELVEYYSEKYKVIEKEMLAVINCESGFNPLALNKGDPNGGSKGIAQFQQETFDRYSQELKIENPDIWNVEQQIEVMAYMFSLKEQHQWSCYNLIEK